MPSPSTALLTGLCAYTRNHKNDFAAGPKSGNTNLAKNILLASPPSIGIFNSANGVGLGESETVLGVGVDSAGDDVDASTAGVDETTTMTVSLRISGVELGADSVGGGSPTGAAGGLQAASSNKIMDKMKPEMTILFLINYFFPRSSKAASTVFLYGSHSPDTILLARVWSVIAAFFCWMHKS